MESNILLPLVTTNHIEIRTKNYLIKKTLFDIRASTERCYRYNSINTLAVLLMLAYKPVLYTEN